MIRVDRVYIDKYSVLVDFDAIFGCWHREKVDLVEAISANTHPECAFDEFNMDEGLTFETKNHRIKIEPK